MVLLIERFLNHQGRKSEMKKERLHNCPDFDLGCFVLLTKIIRSLVVECLPRHVATLLKKFKARLSFVSSVGLLRKSKIENCKTCATYSGDYYPKLP